jgi:hypothetical protein
LKVFGRSARRLVVEKAQQLKSFAIGETALDPHVVSRPEIAEMLSIGISRVG